MPDSAVDQLLQQAIADHRAGRLREAENAYRRVLEQQPQNVDALHLLGVIAGMSGDFQQAAELIGRAAAIQPANADILCNFGNALRQTGQIQGAAETYLRAAQLRPLDADPLLEAGSLLIQLRDYERALEVLHKAVAIAPHRGHIHRELGIALHQLQRHSEAIERFLQALQTAPQDVRAIAHLALSLRYLGRHEESRVWAQKILDLGEAAPPEYRAAAMENLDRIEESCDQYRNAIVANPANPLILHNLGNLLLRLGQSDEALECFDSALAIAPKLPILHLDRAMVLLLKGNFEQGWREYDWRWQCRERHAPRRPLAQPLCRDQDVAGKTVLLYAEQGLGDAIQFMRYAPLVAERGAKVILEVQPELAALARSLTGIEQVIAAGAFQSLPESDLHAPLMDLPLILGTTLQSIPSDIPYLHADSAKVQAWSARLARDEPSGRPRLRVGLVWAGKPTHAFDRERSIALQQLAPLARSADHISFISLQKGPAAQQLAQAPSSLPIRIYADELRDFSDTAALLENLDLLISADTSVAHLAGALGRPVWVLLPVGPDWRWMEKRHDSPWYPTLRLFRQQKARDWSATIEELTSELCKLAAR